MTTSGISVYEFDFRSLRQPEESPSVFSVLVNANSKLQNIVGSGSGSTLFSFSRAVADAVAAIFHVPKEVLDQTPSLIPPVPALPSAHYPGVGTSGTSSEAGRESSVHGGQHSMDFDQESEEGPFNFADNVEDVNFEEDNEPDTINGLTFSEMRSVLQRVSGGTISDAERGDAAMLMLGMAGGHQRPLALSPLITDSA